MLRDGVAVQFRVSDDAPFYSVPLHHRQQQRTKTLSQPLLASVCLLSLRKQLGHRRDRLVRAVLRKGDGDGGDQESECQKSFHMIIAFFFASSASSARNKG